MHSPCTGKVKQTDLVSVLSFSDGVFLFTSIDPRKLKSICFYNNMEKVRAELALFRVEKARTLHL